MILAELSEDRLRDENEIAGLNPTRLDDAVALVSAIIRRRVADLCLIARDPDAPCAVIGEIECAVGL